MNETMGERLRRLRKAAKLTQTELAVKAGLGQSAIGNIEADTRGYGVSIVAIAKILETTPDYLADGHEIRPLIAREPSNIDYGPAIRGTVPLLSNVQAGKFTEVLEGHLDEHTEQIPTIVQIRRYTFALRVKGDSMEPEFKEGALLIVEPELDPLPNDYVIVRNGSEETVFKQLIKDGADWLLKPLNERYPIKPLGSSTIVGVVRGSTKNYR